MVLMLGVGSVMAQGAAEPRQFDPERLERYRSNPDYQYDRPTPEPPERPKPEELIRERPEAYTDPRIEIDGPNIGGIVKVIFWISVIGGGGFMLLQIFRVRLKNLFKKKSDEGKVEFEEVLDPEDISNLELDDPIRNAIDKGQYRKATRLLYLKALRQMQDRSMIVWRREKTNRDYLRELKIRELRPPFRQITHLFEYIWYGEVPLDQDNFNQAYATFVEFDQELRRYDEG